MPWQSAAHAPDDLPVRSTMAISALSYCNILPPRDLDESGDFKFRLQCCISRRIDARLTIAFGRIVSQSFLYTWLCLCSPSFPNSHFRRPFSMSNSHPPNATATATPSNNFQLIFNNALKAYETRTKKDLLTNPLAVELQNCNSPSAILAVLHRQVQGLDQSPSSDDRWTKWLDPTVNVLNTLSDILGEGVSLVSFRI
jgi:hypothetical protein